MLRLCYFHKRDYMHFAASHQTITQSTVAQRIKKSFCSWV